MRTPKRIYVLVSPSMKGPIDTDDVRTNKQDAQEDCDIRNKRPQSDAWGGIQPRDWRVITYVREDEK